MKFLLESAGTYYSTKKAKKLKALGFQFDEKKEYVDATSLDSNEYDKDDTAWVKQDRKVPIRLKSLKELCKLAEDMKETIIITLPHDKKEPFGLLIHDSGYID